jgi:hypothetical protein
MRESEPVGDLVAAVSDTLRGDRSMLGDMAAVAQRRAQDRIRDRIAPDPQQARPATPIPAAVARRVPQPGGRKAIEIRFANGQRVRATIAPAVARRRDLAALARVSGDNDRRAFAALRRHRTAIHRLTRSQTDLSKKVSTLQAQADLTLVGVVQGFAGLDRRVRTVTTQTQAVIGTATSAGTQYGLEAASRRGDVRAIRYGRQLQAQRLQQARAIRQLATRAQIQNVSNIVNSVQTTAFGQQGSLFATNNLLLAGNQLFWSLLDPVLQRAGVLNATSSTIVAGLAPLGTLLTGQILLAERQRVRFVSGVAVFDGTNLVVTESLRDSVGEAFWPAFRKRTDVPVTLTVLEAGSEPPPFVADVVEGVLRVRMRAGFSPSLVALLPRARVAWMVDTGADVE